MERYQRQIQLDTIGLEGQQKLSQASVLVIGAGGLGCPILQYLAAAGLGKLGIADMDTVSVSNLHRQVLYTEADLGRPKTEAALDRLKAVNSEVEFQLFSEGFNERNALNMISDYDLIIDGTDNFETRYLVNDACVRSNKPWIYGALFKNEGQFALFNAFDGPTYRCLYPKPPLAGEVPNCNEMGILGTVSGLVATHMAHLSLQFLLWPEAVPADKVFYLNTATYSLNQMTLKRNEEKVAALVASKEALKKVLLRQDCQTTPLELSEALEIEGALLIDVRRPEELPQIESAKVTQIPLETIKDQLDALDSSATYVMFCQVGIRAQKAADLLIAAGFSSVYALSESAAEIKSALKTNKLSQV